MNPAGSLLEEPLFLCGTTRSGTTLLSLMLGHHPSIAFVGEYEWVWDFPSSNTPPPLQPYYAWLATHRHFRHHRLNIDRSLEFAQLARSFLEQMRVDADPHLERPWVGCQIHRNYSPALAAWPRARFIHIVRDGRDVCASWVRLGWLGNAYEAARRWREALAEWSAVKAATEPGRRIELRFEDLIQDPPRELARLCEFIGVPYSAAMLRYHEDTTYEPVDRAQGSKWRQELAAREVSVFEAVAGRELAAHGYALSGEPPYALNAWSRRLLSLEDKLRHHRSRVRMYGAKLWLADILARRVGVGAWRDRVRLAMNEAQNAKMK